MKQETLDLLASSKAFLEEDLDVALDSAAKLRLEVSLASCKEAVDRLLSGRGPVTPVGELRSETEGLIAHDLRQEDSEFNLVYGNRAGAGLCNLWAGCECVLNIEDRDDTYLRPVNGTWTAFSAQNFPPCWGGSEWNIEAVVEVHNALEISVPMIFDAYSTFTIYHGGYNDRTF